MYLEALAPQGQNPLTPAPEPGKMDPTSSAGLPIGGTMNIDLRDLKAVVALEMAKDRVGGH